VLFNPVSRDVIELQAASSAAFTPEIGADEKKRVALLVAQMRQGRGQGEFLSSAALASVMPFETQRAPGTENGRERSRLGS
jgi:hypothetical protein